MSDQSFRAEPHLEQLRPFQRATVEHITDVLYRNKTGTRFLVADETGLGKTMVARGVIARAIEALQDDPEVDRIDVIYICSNADVARQNIQRLDILGNQVHMSTRLSLLAASTEALKKGDRSAGKPVNLVSLTPRTSFPEKGWRSGTAQERALLMVILADRLQLAGAAKTAAYRILQGTVASLDAFKQRVADFEIKLGARPGQGAIKLDQQIVEKFWDLVGCQDDGDSVLQSFQDLLAQTTGKSIVPGGFKAASVVVSKLRKTLARASVDALEPDLVILDEFQRFTELLNADDPVSELAQDLFNYKHAKVLLLSATPYKPIDDGTDVGDSHQSQFLGVLDFLARNSQGEGAEGIEKLLGEYREAVKNRRDPGVLRDRLRSELLALMCRTERPPRLRESIVKERRVPASAISAEGVTQFIKLTELAELVDTSLPMDVWKSVPELVHFFDGYLLGQYVAEDVVTDEEVKALVRSLDRLDPNAVDSFAELPVRNPRLQALIDQTTAQGWETMLWMPPSLPYLKPGGPYASSDAASMTKKLVFSQWTATPTAVASLLSHDASRRIARSGVDTGIGVTASSENVSQRLQFRKSGDQLTAMAGFLPFFPMPGLADMADPLLRAGAAGRPFGREYAESRIAGDLVSHFPEGAAETGASEVASRIWEWPLALSDTKLDAALSGAVAGISAADAIAGRGAKAGIESADDRADQKSVIDEYVAAAVQAHRNRSSLDLSRIPPKLAEQTARLAMHSPANCAWRAFGRLSVDVSAVTDAGRWRASAIVASGLRGLFNRWESALILDKLYGVDTPYWQKVLSYCADGNLQAVLDEYLFHLVQVEGNSEFDDEALIKFAWHAAGALKLKPATYRAKDPLQEGGDIDFTSRFALRYGVGNQNDDSARPGEIREAFNSPFWPFVLVSTSVGQEGIDFHPWCHNLVHWNVPGNPVDFEQRDGRVNRFRGHAVRRNIADMHGSKMLAAINPWDEAYRLAEQDAPHTDIPGLAPEWIYPGRHKVIRDVMPYQLSVDSARLKRTHERVALYRLAFGQPRQEDLLELLRSAGVSDEQADSWRIDLRPIYLGAD